MSGRLQVVFGLLAAVIPAVADRHPAGFTSARRPFYRPCTCGCCTSRVQLCQLRGACLEAGLVLFTCEWEYARRFVMFTVGMYMLVCLGPLWRLVHCVPRDGAVGSACQEAVRPLRYSLYSPMSASRPSTSSFLYRWVTCVFTVDSEMHMSSATAR